MALDDEHDQRRDDDDVAPPKDRPWGPASYWRSGLVVLGIVIVVLLVMQAF